MKKYINKDLARRRGLTKRDKRSLNALHYAMEVMVEDSNYASAYFVNSLPSDEQRKHLRKAVREIEFLMQDIWGFERDEACHTHKYRFEVLYPAPALLLQEPDSETRAHGY